MEARIRLGVLGCSSIAERKVIPAILASDRFVLSATASRSPDKARRYAERFHCSASSYEDLLQRDDVDAVYVSLPVGLHHEWALKTLTHGKHLLLEKTFTRTYREAEEVIATAAARQLTAMEALAYVHHPLFRKVHSLVESGAIGRVRQIEAVFGFPDPPAGDIRHDRQLGGGAILDTLIYPLSFCLSLRADPHRRLSYSNSIHDTFNVDARGSVRLDWDNCTALISYGFGFMYRNSFVVWGDEGCLSASRVFSRPADYEGDILITGQRGVDRVEVPAANQFLLMLDEFHRKIAGGDVASPNESQDILRRMAIISEIYTGFDSRSGGREPDVEVSVVIPVFQAAEVIESTVAELVDVLRGRISFELILVNDGSNDRSGDVIGSLAERMPRTRALNLMRNFGQHNAIMAGLHEARGKYIVMIDDDGQHDPACIPQLVAKLRQGSDVVYVSYEAKQYGAMKNLGSKINDVMSTALLDKPRDLYLSSFKAITSAVRDQIIRYTGPHPYVDGLILAATRNVATVPAVHRGTAKRTTTYSISGLVGLWLNMFTNFSVRPLRTIFLLGSVTGLVSLVLAAALSANKIFRPDYAPSGWTMLAVLLLFFGALQLMCLGLVAECVGRILLLVNRRPQFAVRDAIEDDE